jgi:pyruvate,water dikinase
MYPAAALVVEIGGQLSHAAVVARELGIPCVMGIPGVTRGLRDGDLVRVDGTTGRVEVIEASGDAA